MDASVLAAAIFVVTYVLIVTDRFDRTAVAVAGAVVAVGLGLTSQPTRSTRLTSTRWGS